MNSSIPSFWRSCLHSTGQQAIKSKQKETRISNRKLRLKWSPVMTGLDPFMSPSRKLRLTSSHPSHTYQIYPCRVFSALDGMQRCSLWKTFQSWLIAKLRLKVGKRKLCIKDESLKMRNSLWWLTKLRRTSKHSSWSIHLRLYSETKALMMRTLSRSYRGAC